MVPSRPCSYPVVLGRPTLCCRNGQGCSREGSAGLVNPPLEGSPYCPAASGHISPCFEGEPVFQQADSEVDLFTLKTKFQVHAGVSSYLQQLGMGAECCSSSQPHRPRTALMPSLCLPGLLLLL